jgi:Ca2+-binding RTX toxin-like protein
VTFFYKVGDGEATSGEVTAYLDLLPVDDPVPPPDQVLYGDYRKNTIWGGDGHDRIYGRGSDDRLYGDSGNDKLYGEAGNDALYGGNGDDQVWGGAGNDRLAGLDGNDTLSGGSGNDVLSGGDDNDSLFGGAGRDVLVGGTGRDVMSGGSDWDVFRFRGIDNLGPSLAAADHIVDFQGAGAPGGDKIDLRAIDAIAGGADNAFAFIGQLSFFAPGQLRYTFVNGNTVLEGNTIGNGGAEFRIVLAGIHALNGFDITL